MASRAVKLDPTNVVTSTPDAIPEQVDDAAVAARAYELWEERGRPIGSDLEDWYRAEQELRGQTQTTTA
jgi:hypothetical protein